MNFLGKRCTSGVRSSCGLWGAKTPSVSVGLGPLAAPAHRWHYGAPIPERRPPSPCVIGRGSAGLTPPTLGAVRPRLAPKWTVVPSLGARPRALIGDLSLFPSTDIGFRGRASVFANTFPCESAGRRVQLPRTRILIATARPCHNERSVQPCGPPTGYRGPRS